MTPTLPRGATRLGALASLCQKEEPWQMGGASWYPRSARGNQERAERGYQEHQEQQQFTVSTNVSKKWDAQPDFPQYLKGKTTLQEGRSHGQGAATEYSPSHPRPGGGSGHRRPCR